MKLNFPEFKQKKETYDSDFYIDFPYYKLTITMHTRNRFLRLVFNTVCRKLNVRGKSINHIDEIDIDMKYFKLLKTTMQKIINDEIKTAAEKGVYVQTSEIALAKFKRDSQNKNIWNIIIEIVGEYAGKK